MKITIKHFVQTGFNLVLMNENKELMYDANDNALFGYTRKEAEALALRVADDMISPPFKPNTFMVVTQI